MSERPMLTMDGEYPSDACYPLIAAWPIQGSADCRALLDAVRDVWWMPDWGWTEYDGEDRLIRSQPRPMRVYHISTGGWSGNEALISALRDNYIFWSLCWHQSRTGGHYEFRVRETPAHA